MDLPKVGEPAGEKQTVFELVLSDHIEYIDPSEYGLKKEKGIDPNYYFITSGDAVEKAKVLERDMWKYAGELSKRAKEKPKDKKLQAYRAAIYKQAGRARALLNVLIKTKGDNCFLETEWENHRLKCAQKNPRR